MKFHPLVSRWLVTFAALMTLAGATSANASADGCIAAYGNSSMGAILSLVEAVPMTDEEREYAQNKLNKLARKVHRICECGFTRNELEDILKVANRAGTFCEGGDTWTWMSVKRYVVDRIADRRMDAALAAGMRAFEDEHDLPHRDQSAL